MRNSKLYSILEHFDKYEQNHCRKYISSPYFNKDKTLLNLFNYLTSDIDKHKSNGHAKNELSKEKVWSKLKTGREYDDVRFRKYCSDLLKLVEGFLAQKVFEEKELSKANLLMEAVKRKKLVKLYKSTLRTARRLSDQLPYRSAPFYYHQYEIENNYYRLTQFEIKRSDKSNEEEISRNLDYFYLAEKLRLYCSVLSRQNVSSHTYELAFADKIIALVEQNNFDDIPPIAIYYQIFLVQTNSSEEHYFKFKELLEKYVLLFPPNEGYIIYTYALNYCIHKVNKGNQKFSEELFSIYRTGIENEILLEDGNLSPWHFQNIIMSALRLGKYEWAKQFVEDYQQKLPESFRENAYTYSLAQVYFYQKKHDKVIQLLQEVEYEDVSYNLRSKAMLIATYYETDELEPLYSLFESFRAYLNRHKDIPPQRRNNYSNLIKFTKKLTKMLPRDKKSLEKLKQEIRSTKNIASKGWLIEKIAELE